MEDRDDETLMSAYQAGDAAAFKTLYERSSGRVYGYLKGKLKRPEERDEVFQQIFLKLHHSRSRYSREYSWNQWLFVISKSVLLDHLRKKRRSPQDLATAGTEEAERIAAPLPQETQPTAAFALDALSPEQRQIVNWRVLDELSYEEISSKLNRSETSVRQILSRALKRLRTSAPWNEIKSGESL